MHKQVAANAAVTKGVMRGRVLKSILAFSQELSGGGNPLTGEAQQFFLSR